MKPLVWMNPLHKCGNLRGLRKQNSPTFILWAVSVFSRCFIFRKQETEIQQIPVSTSFLATYLWKSCHIQNCTQTPYYSSSGKTNISSFLMLGTFIAWKQSRPHCKTMGILKVYISLHPYYPILFPRSDYLRILRKWVDNRVGFQGLRYNQASSLILRKKIKQEGHEGQTKERR